MSKPLVHLARLAVVLCLAGTVVVGCGRKGDLDRPSTPVEEQNKRRSGTEKPAQPVEDRPFVLDPLL
jgi:predicted small lipoprotein YifL